MKTWRGWSLGCGRAPKLWPRSPNQDTRTHWDPLAHAPLRVPRGSITESQGMERASWGGEFSNWNCMLYKSSPFNRRPDTHTHTHSHAHKLCPHTTTSPKPWGRSIIIANFIPQQSISMDKLLDKIDKGGGVRFSLWFHFHSSLVPLWFLFGSSLVPLWFLFGSSLVPLWFLFGSSLVPLRFLFGSSSLVPLWFLFGSSLLLWVRTDFLEHFDR